MLKKIVCPAAMFVLTTLPLRALGSIPEFLPIQVPQPSFVAQFAATLQRAILDRPAIDKTDLTGSYDFDLEWTYDDTQFGGTFRR